MASKASNALIVSSATANTVLQSGGNSSAPAYSSATYPTTAGTSGNILTSDGTNWNSTAPNFIITPISLTNMQLSNLASTAVSLVSAQGSGIVIVPFGITLKLVYGGSNAYTNAPSIYLQYGATVGVDLIYTITTPTNFWEATGNFYSVGNLTTAEQYAATIVENTALSIGLSTALTGNAAANNTVTGSLAWYALTI